MKNSAVSSGHGLTAEATRGQIRLYRAGESDPLVVQHAAPGLRPHLHPLHAPDSRGGTLTEDAPHHHPWQHGLYVGLNDVNGIGFWKEGGTDGTFHPDPLAPPRIEDGTASWHVHTEWRVPGGEAILSETQAWTLTDDPAGGTYILDLAWSLSAAADGGDVRFGGYPYGGLFLRMPYRSEAAGSIARSSEGRENGAAEQQRARWVAVCLPLPDRDPKDGPCGIAILDHPDNPEHPTPWRVDAQLGVAPSRSIAGPWILSPGETTVSRYRLFAFAGPLDPSRIDAEWQRFAATELEGGTK
jgi:hypothetical protein